MRQSRIFFIQLLRVAAQFYIWTIGFIRSVPVGHMWLATTIPTTTATTATFSILRLSHKLCYQLS